MVCRSPGCNSIEHLQYSGQCPVQRRREKRGNARAYMAAQIEEDVNDGVPIDEILTEILFSQPTCEAHEESDSDADIEAGVGFVEENFLADTAAHEPDDSDETSAENFQEGRPSGAAQFSEKSLVSQFGDWWQRS